MLLNFWPLQAGEGQLPSPTDDWSTWLFLGGRGAGKTRAGAEWITDAALHGGRFALIGPTLHDVREVMIEGPSGLRAVAARHGERVRYEVSRRRLRWENGAEAHVFSAQDPESLRGPQHHGAWADEFCAWSDPEEAVRQVRLGLRLGRRPRLAVTTTPKPLGALRKLMGEPRTEVSRARTGDNARHLAPAFLEGLQALYAGTRLEAQELDGLVVEGFEDALWRAEDLARCRGKAPARLDRVVVAVDPPAGLAGAACGIVAAGRADGRAYVLADASARGLTPIGWAERVVRTAEQVDARHVVAEANQGGEMVRSVLQTAGCVLPVKLVHASRGKRARAEPVAALYERGRVTHVGRFAELEEEMMTLGDAHAPSPDRADALVWALTDLLLEPESAPRVRVL